MAHEVNNALNGASMNLEVVRLRAVAGRDAGAVAPFAAAALEEQAAVAAMTGALLALARAPRANARADVREALAPVVALTAPVLRHLGVRVRLDLGEPAPTSAPAVAVRLAVVWALEHAVAWVGATPEGAPGNSGDRSGEVRYTVLPGAEPVLAVGLGLGGGEAGPDDQVPALLAEHGIRVDASAVEVRVTFPSA